MHEKRRIGVIIPALNEAESLPEVLKHLPPSLDRVIVVDNGSNDGTAEVAGEYGAEVLREPRRGYGAACLRGIAAIINDVDLIAFIDGDYSDRPEELRLLIDKIKSGYDFVLGSRMLKSQARRALTTQARFGNRLATFLIRLRFGFRYSDLGPMRVIRSHALQQLKMVDRNYGWTVEMQIKAVKQGLRIAELPVSYRQRFSGKSKVAGSLRGSIGAAVKIIATIIRYAR